MKHLKLIIILSIFCFPLCGQNKVIVDERINQPVLYGRCNLEGIEDSTWYQQYYDDYIVDEGILSGINTGLLMASDIQIILGTWCSDSKKEVPRFYKIMKQTGYPISGIDMICVDRSKESKHTRVAELNIERVPTFIFYINGKEYARIVERPITGSLEGDLLKYFDSR